MKSKKKQRSVTNEWLSTRRITCPHCHTEYELYAWLLEAMERFLEINVLFDRKYLLTCPGCLEEQGLNHASLIPSLFNFPVLVKYQKNVPPRKTKQVLSREDTTELSAVTMDTLYQIHAAALDGDDNSLICLFNIATLAVQYLENLYNSPPPYLLKITRRQYAIPAFISPHSANAKICRQRVQALQVAKDLSYSTRYHPNAYPTILAIHIEIWLQRNRNILDFLPRLTRKTARQVFDVGWSAFLHVAETTKAHFTFKIIEQIGRHRRHHTENTGAQENVTPKTAAANTLDGAKQAVFQSFKGLHRLR